MNSPRAVPQYCSTWALWLPCSSFYARQAMFESSAESLMLRVCTLVASIHLLQACITIQKHVRGHAVRQEVARQTAAATRIQCCWRCHQAVMDYNALRAANMRLQAGVRRWAARLRYRRTKAAVITVQVCRPMLTLCALLSSWTLHQMQ